MGLNSTLYVFMSWFLIKHKYITKISVYFTSLKCIWGSAIYINPLWNSSCCVLVLYIGLYLLSNTTTNISIHSLTYQCPSLSVLVIQFLLHVSVHRTILRQYSKHLTLLNWAYIWIHIYLHFCCIHRLCFVCNMLNKYMNLLCLKY
jgi:hypothetical protein